MKKLTMITLLSLLLVAVPAAAQDDEMKVSVGAKAGWFWFQDEPLSDSISDSWSIAGEVILWFGNGFGIGGEVEYLTKENDSWTHQGFDTTVEYTQIPLNLNLYYSFPMDNSDLRPYIGAGPSFVLTDLSTEANNAPVAFESDENAFGFTVFGGFDYKGFIVEAQYLWAENDIEHLAAGTIEGNTHGFSLWGGFRF